MNAKWLVQRTRHKLNEYKSGVEKFDAARFWLDKEIREWINEAHLLACSILSPTNAITLKEDNTLSLTTDVYDYDLPTDFVELHEVYLSNSTRGQQVRCNILPFEKFQNLTGGGAGPGVAVPNYYYRTDDITPAACIVEDKEIRFACTDINTFSAYEFHYRRRPKDLYFDLFRGDASEAWTEDTNTLDRDYDNYAVPPNSIKLSHATANPAASATCLTTDLQGYDSAETGIVDFWFKCTDLTNFTNIKIQLGDSTPTHYFHHTWAKTYSRIKAGEQRLFANQSDFTKVSSGVWTGCTDIYFIVTQNGSSITTYVDDGVVYHPPELPEQYHGLLVEYAYAMALMKDGVDASQILDKFHSDLDKIKTPEPNYSGEIE